MNRRRFLASILPVAALAASQVRAEPERGHSLCAANCFCECGHLHRVELLHGPRDEKPYRHQIQEDCGCVGAYVDGKFEGCPCTRFRPVQVEVGNAP